MRSTISATKCSNCTQQLLRSILSTTLDASPSARNRMQQSAWPLRTLQPYEARRGAARVTMPKQYRSARPDVMLAIQKEAASMQRSAEATEMIGVLPDTLVMPEKLIQWFNIDLLVTLLRIRAGELYTYWAARRAYKKAKSSVEITKKGVAETGKILHQRMSQAFAAGDLKPVTKHLCTGLRDTLERRIAKRPKTQVLNWSCPRRFGAPQIVSFKAMLMPARPGEPEDPLQPVLMQAVVRLKMRQRLDVLERKRVRSGNKIFEQDVPVKDNLIEKNIVEHVVLQRSLNLEKDNPWKVYGLYEMKGFKEWQRDNKNLKQQMQAAQAQLSAKGMV